jgi:hypothetical protein
MTSKLDFLQEISTHAASLDLHGHAGFRGADTKGAS